MGSSSDSSSSDEDFDIFNIIGGDNNISRPKEPPYKRRQLRSTLPKMNIPLNDDDDDFDIKIPSIFTIQAKKNEELLNIDRNIKQYMQQEEENVTTQYNKIVAQKQAILDELNDETTLHKSIPDNDKRNDMVEELVKQVNDFGDDSLARKFYFYTKMPNIKLDCSVRRRISAHLFQMKPSAIFDIFKPRFSQFINYCITNCTNETEFSAVLNSMDGVFLEQEMTVQEFSSYLEIMGGDINVLNSDTITLKLSSRPSNIRLHILRLALIFKFGILCTKSEILYKYIFKAYILSILDYNLNHYGCDMLADFSTTILNDLISWRLQDLSKFSNDKDNNYNLVVSEIKAILDSSLVTRKYKGGQYKLIKYHHEFISRVLDISICRNKDENTAKILFLLSITILLNISSNEANELVKNSTSIISVLKKVAEGFELFDFNQFSNKDCISSVNKIYITYYKLLHFRIIFHSQYQASITRCLRNGTMEVLKSDLKDLAALTGKLEQNLFSQFKLAGIFNLKGTQLYYKNEMINYTTHCYRIVNLLHKQLTKEVGFEGTGSFYSK